MRQCEKCGVLHSRTVSPICNACRQSGSKKQCPIEGCNEAINFNARTCLKHRKVKGEYHDNCIECGIPFGKPLARGVCGECQASTYTLCACGCGNHRKKYSKDGFLRPFISGHNDNWGGAHIDKPCAVCGELFRGNYANQRLCSAECRTKWLTINPPNERKRIDVECSVCGAVIQRTPSAIGKGGVCCSDKCRYKWVSAKLSENISQPKRLALRRDRGKCVLCGFDEIVHVHHIHPKHKGGGDELENLITLCPNHHALADRRLIEAETLKQAIGT